MTISTTFSFTLFKGSLERCCNISNFNKELTKEVKLVKLENKLKHYF